jgi:transaldolase
MYENLKKLSDDGVSIWLDDLSRDRIRTGNLAELVRDKHVTGVTTNPSIFQKAISGSATYDDQVKDLAVRKVTVDEAIRMITTRDVRDAADILRPVYDATHGVDGRVLIKIPATRAGLPAITAVLAEGISVNVTLIFSLERYREVMDAFVSGLEQAKANGHDVGKIQSVASFFVSRVDTEIDKRLKAIGSDAATSVLGKAAVANARLAYEAFEEVFSSERWAPLKAAGATAQRPLWASTGVKDPAYKDTLYVDDLIVAGTVNTMPEATLNAEADHGAPNGDAVTSGYADAKKVIADVEALGISYDEVVQLLEDEGVEKFEASWKELLDAVQAELTKLGGQA